jgi:hypothetical protein
MEASGSVPAAVLDGGAVKLWLGRGDMEGPDCFSDLSQRSPPHKPGTYVLFSQSIGVFYNMVHLHWFCFNISL